MPGFRPDAIFLIIVAFASPGGGCPPGTCLSVAAFPGAVDRDRQPVLLLLLHLVPDRPAADVLIHMSALNCASFFGQVQLLRALEIARSPVQRVSTVP